MIANYFRIAVRNFLRQWTFSLLNIAGLAVGITTSILIFLWVADEWNYDKFHKSLPELYRVYETQQYVGQDPLLVYNTPGPLAPALSESFPEIKRTARFSPVWFPLILKNDDQVYHESNGYFADPEALEMFTFEFLSGDGTNLLDSPDNIIITRALAQKYFGSDNPVGKSIIINSDFAYNITAVVEKPVNSHFNFDFIFSFETNVQRYWGPNGNSWGSNSFFTYVQIERGTDYIATEEKIKDFIRDHQEQTTLHLEPLSDSYLYNIWGTGAIHNVRIFSAVALIVLLIACINFMNLSTARSTRRAREVGLRKVIGGTRTQIAAQFLGESVMYAVIALILALVMTELLMPGFNSLAGKDLSLHTLTFPLMAGMIVITIFTGVVSGSYPAVFLSSFKPVQVLKGKQKAGSKSFRRALVVFQFALSVTLIISTLVIKKQMNYVQNMDPGFQKEHIVSLFISSSSRDKRELLKQEFSLLPGVVNVTSSNNSPAQIGSSTYGINWEGKDPEERVLFNFLHADFDFTETFGIEMAAGRSFSREYASDSAAYIVNEEAARFIGGDDIIGKPFNMWGNDGTIIGVVKDFHFHNLKHRINPLVIRLSPEDALAIHLRLNSDSVVPAMEEIKQTWDRICQDDPVNYQFLDQQFDRMYRAEQRMSKLFVWFSALAVIVSCLGLFGLASYMAEQKTREIGVRKVFGAGIWQILLLMVNEFTRWVLIAILIGSPVAWFLMNRWLENFVYRADQGILIFLFTALVTFVIAIFTVSFQAARAALSNPSDSLRYE
jgi:putative ABC transport system permease protein